ncbi:DoxX family protein [Burkholderia cepacia]|uniref:DoxX family protein n=1 Tax=Burkholderia cepacia TaxID=292 RepID=UPI00158AA74F|nr:DoxX family membrane protein [Burkholderia cepacia]
MRLLSHTNFAHAVCQAGTVLYCGLRIGVGLFISIAGYQRLFPSDTSSTLLDVLRYAVALHPGYAPVLVDTLSAAVELVCGLFLACGCLTHVSAWLLMACALNTSLGTALRIQSIGLGPLDWFGAMLVEPAGLWTVPLAWFAVSGPGPLSFDEVRRATSEHRS